MESEATQQLEDSFSQLLTEAIVDRFRSKMKSGLSFDLRKTFQTIIWNNAFLVER